jgi:hypothetical protein
MERNTRQRPDWQHRAPAALPKGMAFAPVPPAPLPVTGSAFAAIRFLNSLHCDGCRRRFTPGDFRRAGDGRSIELTCGASGSDGGCGRCAFVCTLAAEGAS